MGSKKIKARNIGIKAIPPDNSCNDIHCPWHGSLSLRGRVFIGDVIKSNSAKTAIVKWGFHRYIPKFESYERRNTRVTAYNPLCINAKVGDKVKIAECRPLSKTKSFVVIEVLK